MKVFMGLFFGLPCSTAPHMKLGPQVCHLRSSVGQKMLFYNYCSIFGLLCLENSIFLSLLWSFNHFLMLKLPPRSPYGLIAPKFMWYCQLTKISTSFVNLLHFFHIRSLFGSTFSHFLTPPLYFTLSLGSPYGPLNLKSIT